MTVRKQHFRSVRRAFACLEDLAQDRITRYIFRGHKSAKYRLKTSLERQWPFSNMEGDRIIDRMIRQYQDGLARRGISRLDNASRLDW